MVTFMLAVSQPQAKAFLETGYDVVSGFAVDAATATSVTNISDLMDLLCLRFPDSPYSEDEPLDIIHLPSDPFTMDRLAVGPLHPQAIRGGVIEFGNYDGSGVARGGGVETELLLVDPARITAGSTLWRFHPGNPEPVHRGTYHGIAYGWENHDTGTFKAAVPTPFLGPVVRRDWGSVPCDVELGEDGTPASVTMVAPVSPEQEDGFQELESGMWAKRIAVDDHSHIYTDFVTGRVSGLPVRIVRSVRNNDAFMFQVAASLTDALYLQRAKFQRWSNAIFTALVDPAHITHQNRQEAKPVRWDVADRPPIATRPANPVDFSNSDSLLRETFGLMSETAPPGWEEVTLRIQLVGTSAIYEGFGKLSENKHAALRVIPTAIIHHMRRLKQDRALAGEEPFFVAVIRLEKDGKGTLNINGVKEPVWADHVEPIEWHNEVAAFPRTGSTMPDWLLDRVSHGAPDHPVNDDTSSLSPYPQDLTANIHWINDITGEEIK